jgi:hypothetical protein
LVVGILGFILVPSFPAIAMATRRASKLGTHLFHPQVTASPNSASHQFKFSHLYLEIVPHG